MPAVDVQALLAEDAQAGKDVPFRFGYGINANINIENSGVKVN